MPQNVKDYLSKLNTTDAVRADTWDALYASNDSKVVEQRLRSLKGLSDEAKADLWDLRFRAETAATSPLERARERDARMRSFYTSVSAFTCTQSATLSPTVQLAIEVARP